MKRDRIKVLLSEGSPEQDVTVCAWVRTKRESKNFAFVVVNDGSTQSNLQVVVDANVPGFDNLKDMGTGAAVKIVGSLKESPAKGQKWEVQAGSIELLGESDVQNYPLQKKGHSLEFLREIAHLRPRTNTFGAMFRIRNTLAMAIHEFFQSKGFQWVHTPLLTASDGEGAGEMFTVTTQDVNNPIKDDKGQVDFSKDFFGRQAFLCVTGQLEAEFMAMALGDVYTFGPTFRAENSNTHRHLSEFWMVEPEMAFADLVDDMDMAESFLKYLIRTVLDKCPEELEFFEKFYKKMTRAKLEKLATSKFARLTYTEAIDKLEKSGQKFEYPIEWGVDLHSEHEKYLTDVVYKKPVIVHDYPKDIKAFYMRMNDDGKTVAAMDVLAPGIGEIIGGSQREERMDVLKARMEEMSVPTEDLEWYLDLRRYGSAEHAGFGLGFERLLLYITGMHNIRDAIPCPRFPGHISF